MWHSIEYKHTLKTAKFIQDNNIVNNDQKFQEDALLIWNPFTNSSSS